jgi:type VI secretion system secreted protein Hcp
MAADTYMVFQGYDDKYLASESQVSITKSAMDNASLVKPFTDAGTGNIFEVEDYSFDIEQTTTIGSQSTGAGAAKVSFNPFSITRKIDLSSPTFFYYSCSGKSFKNVYLGLRKAAGTEASGAFFLLFTFKLVAVKTLGWAADEESPKETVTFAYGGLHISYAKQEQNGQMKTLFADGWNQVKNVRDQQGTIQIV